MEEVCSDPYEYCGTAPARGSIDAVRRIPDPSVVVPRTARRVVSEQCTSGLEYFRRVSLTCKGAKLMCMVNMEASLRVPL